jgi:hypothetical protein
MMRLPDFLILGIMKSGTTWLYRWLEQHPNIFLSAIKEPNFFSRDEVWSKGLQWYSELFAAAEDGQLAGEAR